MCRANKFYASVTSCSLLSTLYIKLRSYQLTPDSAICCSGCYVLSGGDHSFCSADCRLENCFSGTVRVRAVSLISFLRTVHDRCLIQAMLKVILCFFCQLIVVSVVHISSIEILQLTALSSIWETIWTRCYYDFPPIPLHFISSSVPQTIYLRLFTLDTFKYIQWE